MASKAATEDAMSRHSWRRDQLLLLLASDAAVAAAVAAAGGVGRGARGGEEVRRRRFYDLYFRIWFYAFDFSSPPVVRKAG